MSEQTDTSTIEALDFDADLRCEVVHYQHQGACTEIARWVRRGRCPECGRSTTYLVCDGAKVYHTAGIATGERVRDTASKGGCGARSPRSAWGYTFTPIGGTS